MPMNQPGQQQDMSLPMIMQAVSQMVYKLAENSVISMDEAKALTDIVPQAIGEMRKQKQQAMQQQGMQQGMQQQAMRQGMRPQGMQQGMRPQMRPADRMARSTTIG